MGSEELSQLAELIRVGAGAARKIATMRPADEDRLMAMIARAEQIALELDDLVAGSPEWRTGA